MTRSKKRTEKKGSARASKPSLRRWSVRFAVMLPFFLLLIVGSLLLGAAYRSVMESPLFRLDAIRVLNPSIHLSEDPFLSCGLQRGSHLLALDLKDIMGRLRRRYPQFKQVIVRRALPNRLEVALYLRDPVVQTPLGRYYFRLDRDFVILPPGSVEPFLGLPIVEGSYGVSRRMKIGDQIRDPSLIKGLKLIQVLQGIPFLKGHTLSRVDAGDPGNIMFYIDDTIEIRIGGQRLSERLKKLERTVREMELDKTKVRYIDLRFDDVVIGPR